MIGHAAVWIRLTKEQPRDYHVRIEFALPQHIADRQEVELRQATAAGAVQRK